MDDRIVSVVWSNLGPKLNSLKDHTLIEFYIWYDMTGNLQIQINSFLNGMRCKLSERERERLLVLIPFNNLGPMHPDQSKPCPSISAYLYLVFALHCTPINHILQLITNSFSTIKLNYGNGRIGVGMSFSSPSSLSFFFSFSLSYS